MSAFENEEAEIKVIEQLPIVRKQVVSAKLNNVPVVNSVEVHDAGLIWKVTPRVRQPNLTNIRIKQELSAVVHKTSIIANRTSWLRRWLYSIQFAVYANQPVVFGRLIADGLRRVMERLTGFEEVLRVVPDA